MRIEGGEKIVNENEERDTLKSRLSTDNESSLKINGHVNGHHDSNHNNTNNNNSNDEFIIYDHLTDQTYTLNMQSSPIHCHLNGKVPSPTEHVTVISKSSVPKSDLSISDVKVTAKPSSTPILNCFNSKAPPTSSNEATSPPKSPRMHHLGVTSNTIPGKPPRSPMLKPALRKGGESEPNIYGRIKEEVTVTKSSSLKDIKNFPAVKFSTSTDKLRFKHENTLKPSNTGSDDSLRAISPFRRRKTVGYVDQINYEKSDKDDEIRHLQTELDKFRSRLSALEELLNKKRYSPETSDNAFRITEKKTSIDNKRGMKDRVFINIGGVRHETYRSTLNNIPDTRLSWIAEESAIHSPEYDPVNGEFFFDRHPQVFSHILNYYRTGNLHVPYDVCGPLFEEELQYWGMDDSQVESCCWLSYRQHRDAQETLKDFEGIELEKDYDDDSEPDLSKFGFDVDNDEGNDEKITWYSKWQPYMWRLMEDPYSSKKAKVIAYISMVLIMLSVMLSCLETVEYFKSNEDRLLALFILEGFCVLYFTIELTVRFVFCPDRIQFLKGILNWIDFMAILPFFVQLILKFVLHSNNQISIFLQILRVFRVFRIIKLSKHSVGLQILGHTLKASFRELLLLIFFLVIGVVIFSSLVYYCEHNQPATKFTSIPATFWWAVITMTTVGYGDMVPESILGRIIGVLCSVSGVLMIALPVPVIVNNFNLYYSHAQARLKLPKKKRRMLVGAANALKTDDFDRRGEQTSEISLQNDDNSSEKSNEDDIDLENEDTLAALRMKRFSRRDSNMFGASTTPPQTNRNVDIAVIHKGRNSSYAMSKRRSLLPTIPTLPEIEP